MPYYNRDPKREHSFDNHPYTHVWLFPKMARMVVSKNGASGIRERAHV